MDIEEIKQFVKTKHAGQTRKQGTPYYLHPFAVANILKEKGFPEEYQITGLLHDTLEDTDTTYDEIKKITNEEIANAVKLVTKEKGYNMQDYHNRIMKNDMAKMVKLADRYHNLSESIFADEKFRQKYIKETTDWYIDMAKGTCFEEDIKKALRKVENSIK